MSTEPITEPVAEVEGKQKRGYRKVKTVILDIVNRSIDGLTSEAVVTQSGVIKWYVQKKLDMLVTKGVIELVDGKYFKKEV